MVSSPAPPEIVLALELPPITTPVDSVEASTFWKPLTLVVSLVVWSAAARLTVAAAFITSVLVPLPPSIETSWPQ